MTTLLVQGWRSISHSYAMVNQYQLLELRKHGDFTLYHQDLPWYFDHWSPATAPSGFAKPQQDLLNAIPALPGGSADITYRIAFPYRLHGGDSRRIFCFGTCEHQVLEPHAVYQGPENGSRHANDIVEIVTPSHWSKEGFLRHGFPECRVHVVPHGVDPAIFRPMAAAERRAARQQTGIPEDRFVFLNVGAMTGNKGISALVCAFDAVRRKHRQAVLLLKDARNLYDFQADKVVTDIIRGLGLDPTVMDHIGIVSENLDLEGLRTLYCLADGYVTPYRAEGFNLPALEAGACGLPVLMTQGGATDDFAHPSFARPVAALKVNRGAETLLEPVLDSLIAGMEEMIERRTGCDPNLAVPWIAENHSWARAIDKLVAVFNAPVR